MPPAFASASTSATALNRTTIAAASAARISVAFRQKSAGAIGSAGNSLPTGGEEAFRLADASSAMAAAALVGPRHHPGPDGSTEETLHAVQGKLGVRSRRRPVLVHGSGKSQTTVDAQGEGVVWREASLAERLLARGGEEGRGQGEQSSGERGE